VKLLIFCCGQVAILNGVPAAAKLIYSFSFFVDDHLQQQQLFAVAIGTSGLPAVCCHLMRKDLL
jgi:hypothetical protein